MFHEHAHPLGHFSQSANSQDIEYQNGAGTQNLQTDADRYGPDEAVLVFDVEPLVRAVSTGGEPNTIDGEPSTIDDEPKGHCGRDATDPNQDCNHFSGSFELVLKENSE